MIMILLALAITAQAQGHQFEAPKNILDLESRIDADESLLYSLLSGRSTFTAIPYYLNGIAFVNTAGNALTFQDGTTQNTAPTTPLTIVSSYTNIAAGTNSATTNSVCIATVTFTPGNVALKVSFVGSFTNNNGTFPNRWGYLINGAYGPGQASDKWVVESSNPGSTTISANMTGFDIIPAQGSGSIAFCVTLGSNGGAIMTWPGGAAIRTIFGVTTAL